MSGYTKEKLYELLPAVYRQRDIENGKPLEALLGIIAEQVEILENDIACLYENLFIETCDEWVVPYIGDLVGARILHHAQNATTTVSQRAWVANTIRYRQGKGTARILEQIARDVTGWDAHVVEFFQILSTTQNLNHLRLQNTRIDIRDPDKLELLDTAFDTIPHTIDVRNITSGGGYHNIPNIGIFLWRLQAYEAKNVPSFDMGEGKFTFSQLGYDMPLFNAPTTETTATTMTHNNTSEEIKVPGLIRRFALYNHLEDYYSSRGRERSIKIMVDGKTVSSSRIVVCDLEDWMHRPLSGKVAVDPERGRISFPINEIPEDVHVTYYYGFSSDLGGGFYRRPELDLLPEAKTYTISKLKLESESFPSIEDATSQWEVDGKLNAIFKILDSESYEISPALLLPENRTVAILAAQKQRPVIRVRQEEEVEEESAIESSLQITGGGDGSRLILDGLLLDLHLRITEKLHDLEIHHCTLVPREEASISYEDKYTLHVSLDRTICGSIILKGSEEAENQESELKIIDSIVDGRAANVPENENDDNNVKRMAIECFKALMENSTVFGEVGVVLLDLASNTIFTDKVKVERRQHGCVRFSYIPDGSEVPRRYRCQPAHGIDAPSMAESSFKKIYPRFTSERYGDPGYAQLHRDVAPEIFEGGDNGAEMGAFNHLYQPQRISNLKLSLEEYLRFGLEAGILLVDGRMIIL
jgi:hypothetical protein